MGIHQRRPQRNSQGFHYAGITRRNITTQLPGAVLVEYQVVHDNRWIDGRWVVSGVVAAEQSAGDGMHCKLVHSNEAGKQYLWTGLSIELHKDDAESFYCNLMSDKPSVFVICDESRTTAATLHCHPELRGSHHLHGD